MRSAILFFVVAIASCGCRSAAPVTDPPQGTEIQVVTGDRIQIVQPRSEEAQQIEIVLFKDDGDRLPQLAEMLVEQNLELSGGMGSFTIGPFECLRTPVENLWIQVTRTTDGLGRETYTARVHWPAD